MNDFLIFLRMGFDHIADLNGYDHMLFIIVLCAAYAPSDWKKVTVLITAFTIGHSSTLALSALKIIIVNAPIIEFLIPLTIFCTCITNLFSTSSKREASVKLSYGLALAFGLIHGMGFSNFFNTLMGRESNITLPLFAFNLGLEIGQLMIVLFFFTFYVLLRKTMTVAHRSWTVFFSCVGVGVSTIMIIKQSV